MYVCVCTHTYIHTYTHIYIIHTHTHSCYLITEFSRVVFTIFHICTRSLILYSYYFTYNRCEGMNERNTFTHIHTQILSKKRIVNIHTNLQKFYLKSSDKIHVKKTNHKTTKNQFLFVTKGSRFFS